MVNIISNNNFLEYIKTKIFWVRFFISFFVLINLIFWLKNYNYFWELYKLTGNFFDSIPTVYDISNTFTGGGVVMIMITTILSSLNIAMLLEFISLQGKLNIKKDVKKENIFVTGAIALAVLASHCASCGVIIIGSFLSLGFLSSLPYGGQELGILAIVILLYTIYNLYKKINNPYVC